jgi:hypothetical protein
MTDRDRAALKHVCAVAYAPAATVIIEIELTARQNINREIISAN